MHQGRTVPDGVEHGLLARARAGDPAAVAELYDLHRQPALRLAEVLAGHAAAEDLLADAFARIVALFGVGAGPTDNFGAYLRTAIRNRHRDLVRRGHREAPVSDHPWLLDGVDQASVEESTYSDLGFDRARAAAALVSLPPAWREIIVLLEVEERSIADVAARLDLSAAAVSSLGYRAREGLRTAYLDQWIREQAPTTAVECRWVRNHLSRHVRGTLGRAATPRVASHVATCPGCAPLAAGLERINHQFGFLRLYGEQAAPGLTGLAG